MSFWRQLGVLLRRDVRIELRTREVLVTAGLFALVLVTLFVFSGFDERVIAHRAAPGVLWVAIAFLGTVVFGRTFQREREAQAIDALLLVPGIMDALFVTRLLLNFALLALIETVMVPVVLATFSIPIAPTVVPLLVVVYLGTFGFAVMGTVLSASLATVHLREVLLPIVLFPLTIPLLVAGVRATAALVAGEGLAATRDWLLLIATFNVAFLALGRWLFGEALDPDRSGRST